MEKSSASGSQLVHNLQVCSDGKPLITGPHEQPSKHSIKKPLLPKSPAHTDGTRSPSDKGGSCARTDASLWKPKGGRSADLLPAHTDGTRSPSDKGGSCARTDASLWKPKGGSSADQLPAQPRFSEEQLLELEKSFHWLQYPGALEKERLSKVLNLTLAQISCWFQRRRMKYKDQELDPNADMLISNYSAPYYPYPEMYAPSACPGLEYNVEGSVSQMHPALLNPAWPMPQFLPVLPPVGYNTAFQLSPPALSPYKGGYPGNHLMPDVD